MNYYCSIIVSTMSFFKTLLIITFALNFYGFFILKITRIESNPKYGQPSTLMAGIATVVFVAYSLLGFIDYYFSYYFFVLFVGFFSFICHIVLFTVKKYLTAKIGPKIALGQIVSCRDFLRAGLTALILGAALSAVWPSGRMEFWLFGSEDYYCWTLLCDYWAGRVDVGVIRLTGQVLVQSLDNFGTSVIFGLYSVADQQSALPASPGFMAALAVWSASIIGVLAGRIFGLGFWAGLVAGLGTVGGSFFNYVVFQGMIGQLVATVAFLAAMERIWAPEGEDDRLAPAVKRLLPPVMGLFLIYPGGFFAFLAALILASAARLFFLSGDVPPWRRLMRAIVRGTVPPLAVLALCCLLSPVGGLHLVTRSFATASQSLGWALPLLGPWLFSGLPIFSPGDFDKSPDPVNGFYFVLFLAALAAMAWGQVRVLGGPWGAGAASTEASDGAGRGSSISAMTVTFGILLAGYLFVYTIIGNSYQLWKFTTFAILPLSFIFLMSIINIVKLYWTEISKLLICTLLAIIIVFTGVKVSFVLPMTKLPIKMYNIRSYAPLYMILDDFIKEIKQPSYVFLRLHTQVEQLVIVEYLKRQTLSIPIVLIDNWILKASDLWDFSGVLANNTNYYIISDSSFDTLFNNKDKQREVGVIAFYNSEWINKHGFVAPIGVDQYTGWTMPNNFVRLKIGLPEDLVGKPVKFTATLEIDGLGEREGGSAPDSAEAVAERCGGVEFLAFHDGGRTARIEGAASWEAAATADSSSTWRVAAVADPSFTSGGILYASIRLRGPGATEAGGPGCRLRLGEVDVEEAAPGDYPVSAHDPSREPAQNPSQDPFPAPDQVQVLEPVEEPA